MSQINKNDLEDFLVNALAKFLEVDPKDIDTSVAFDRYGLDSASAVQLTGDISELIKQKVEPTLLYDYPTIDSLSAFLTAEVAAA
jgi:acyl carrier protein